MKKNILIISFGILIILLIIFSSILIFRSFNEKIELISTNQSVKLETSTKEILKKAEEKNIQDLSQIKNEIMQEVKQYIFDELKNEVLYEVKKDLDITIDKKITKISIRIKKEIKEELKDELKKILLKEILEYLNGDFKNEIKAEIIEEINNEINSKREIVISNLDEKEEEDVINSFWKFMELAVNKNIDNLLQSFYSPVYNFNSGSDILKDDLKNIFLEYFDKGIMSQDTYKNLIQVKSIYFYKSGFRPPITERIGSDDKLIVLSVKIDKTIEFPFPSDEEGLTTIYFVKKPSAEILIIAIGILSDIL